MQSIVVNQASNIFDGGAIFISPQFDIHIECGNVNVENGMKFAIQFAWPKCNIILHWVARYADGMWLLLLIGK